MSPQYSPLVQESFLEEEIPESPQGGGQLPVRRAPSHKEFGSLKSYPCLGYGEERSTQPRGPHSTLMLQTSPDTSRTGERDRERTVSFPKTGDPRFQL